MTTEPTRFHTPVGRFVSGDLTRKRDKDKDNRPIDPDRQRYEFGLAISKQEPGMQHVFATMAQAAKDGYTARSDIQARVDNWFQTLSGFSMKISDGDKPAASTGQVNQNTAGHWVLWFSTALDIKACDPYGQQIDIANIKRGYYVDVAASVAPNGLLDHNAGLYLNPEVVRWIAEGDVISGGIDIEAAMQNAPAVPQNLPPGARAIGASGMTPGAAIPGAAAAPTVPGAPTAPGANPATPAPAPITPGAPVGGPATAHVGAPATSTAYPGNPVGAPTAPSTQPYTGAMTPPGVPPIPGV